MNLFDKFAKKSSFNWLIVGLGNPGEKYENTRHNAGFWIIDKIKEEFNIKKEQEKFEAINYNCEFNNKKILLLKPLTYMNLSGKAVSSAMQFYKIPIQNLVIIYDDISLIPGKLRIRQSGSSGGHNGIKNIIENLNTQDFLRLKIGVGNKPEQMQLNSWVLGVPTKEEKILIEGAVSQSCEAIKFIISDNLRSALNKFSK